MYLAAAPELGDARLAATQAQLACSEAQHIAAARLLVRQVPSDIAWAPPLFYNPPDALPVLEPFLNGARNFGGPVDFPGVEQARNLIGNAHARSFPTFLNTV